MSKVWGATLIYLLNSVNAYAGHVYSYNDNGANWGKKWPLCDHGKEQSPINLTDEMSEVSSKLLI